MRSHWIKSTLMGSAAFAAVVGTDSVSTPAFAQQIGALEEIVVTARRRDESLQDIPLAITAFTAADIENAGIQDLGDLALQTAGMQFFNRRSAFRAGRVDSLINLRGVSSGSSLDHLQPTSLFVDGIFVLGTASSIGLQDLERVEVIKGPQSAFFGRNTFAGAINFITKNPSLTEYETKIDAQAATYEKFDFNLLTSMPLVEDKIALQVNARLYSRGGEWTATDGGTLGSESSSFISGVLYGEPTENLSFKARAYYQRDDDGSPVSGLITGDEFNSCGGTTPVERFNDEGTAKETFFPDRMLCGQPPTFKSGLIPLSRETSLRPSNLAFDRVGFVVSTGALLFGPQPDALREFLIDDKFVKSVPSIDRFGLVRDQIRLSLNMDYDFTGRLEGWTATFLGGWNDMGLNFLRDYDQSDVQSWYSTDPKFGRDWSVEARVASPVDNRLRGLIGVNYSDQEFITSGAGGLLLQSCFTIIPGTAPPGTAPACGGGPGIFTLPATSGNVAKVLGIFGSVSYDITEELTLDIELRYSEDERTAGEATFFNQVTYKDWVPRFILNYRPTDETTVYIQASRGVLPGTTNGLLATCSEDTFLQPYTSPVTGELSTASECDQIRSQLSEGQFAAATPTQELDAAEIGWKQTLMDGRARFNLTAWWYEWKNRPYGLTISWVRDSEDPLLRDRLPNPFPNTLGVSVGGSSEFWGLEFESGMAFTENWDTQLNVSLQDNKITELQSRSSIQRNGGFINLKGLKTLRYPGVMANLSTTYRDALNNTWDWYARADFSYSGSYWGDVDNLVRGPSWFVTNARIGVQREDLRLEFFVRNLFQETAWQTVTQGAHFQHHTFNFGGFRGSTVSPQEKRTFGLRTNITF